MKKSFFLSATAAFLSCAITLGAYAADINADATVAASNEQSAQQQTPPSAKQKQTKHHKKHHAKDKSSKSSHSRGTTNSGSNVRTIEPNNTSTKVDSLPSAAVAPASTDSTSSGVSPADFPITTDTTVK